MKLYTRTITKQLDGKNLENLQRNPRYFKLSMHENISLNKGLDIKDSKVDEEKGTISFSYDIGLNFVSNLLKERAIKQEIQSRFPGA